MFVTSDTAGVGHMSDQLSGVWICNVEATIKSRPYL